MTYFFLFPQSFATHHLGIVSKDNVTRLQRQLEDIVSTLPDDLQSVIKTWPTSYHWSTMRSGLYLRYWGINLTGSFSRDLIHGLQDIKLAQPLCAGLHCVPNTSAFLAIYNHTFTSYRNVIRTKDARTRRVWHCLQAAPHPELLWLQKSLSISNHLDITHNK